MKVFISGINGKMGTILKEEILKDSELELVGGLTRKVRDINFDYLDLEGLLPIDVIIDFSHPSFLKMLLKYSLEKKIPLVIGTTGYNLDELNLIYDVANRIPIIYLENYSLGINAIKSVIKDLEKYLTDFEINIIEKHHKTKIDKPSGTAKLFQKVLSKDVNFYSIRTSNIVGEHKIIFNYLDEEIEITHRAYSKRIFALGAIKCAKLIINKPPKLYSYEELILGG